MKFPVKKKWFGTNKNYMIVEFLSETKYKILEIFDPDKDCPYKVDQVVDTHDYFNVNHHQWLDYESNTAQAN